MTKSLNEYKLAKEILNKEILNKEKSDKESMFLQLELINKLIEMKLIEEYTYLEIIKQSLNQEHEGSDDILDEMNKDYHKAYIKEIDNRLAELKTELNKFDKSKNE